MINLSETEQKLFDFIKESKDRVSVDLIKTILGETYLGALGRLITTKLVEGTKEKGDGVSIKYVKYYKVIVKPEVKTENGEVND